MSSHREMEPLNKKSPWKREQGRRKGGQLVVAEVELLKGGGFLEKRRRDACQGVAAEVLLRGGRLQAGKQG